MSLKKNQLLLLSLNILISVAVIMAFGYVKSWGVFNKGLPYNLSQNYIELIPGDINLEYRDIQDLKITLISEYDDQNYLGLLDTNFYFSYEMKYKIMGMTRYFNEHDYINKTESAILISDYNAGECSLGMERDNTSKDYLFCINSQSSLYKDNIKEIINYTYIDKVPERIFIDSDNLTDLDIAFKKLADLGYVKVESKSITLITSVLYGGRHSNLFLVCVFALYFIFGIVCYYQFLFNKKTIALHSVLGGGIITTAKNTSLLFWIGQVVIPIINTIVFIIYTNMNIFFSYSYLEVYILVIIHTIFINAIYLLIFNDFFKREIKFKEAEYVK